MAVAQCMEVLKVERVVFHLLPVRHLQAGLPNLELQHDDGTRADQHCVDPSPQASQRIFQQQLPFRGFVPSGEGSAQDGERDAPGAQLRGFVVAKALCIIVRETMY